MYRLVRLRSSQCLVALLLISSCDSSRAPDRCGSFSGDLQRSAICGSLVASEAESGPGTFMVAANVASTLGAHDITFSVAWWTDQPRVGSYDLSSFPQVEARLIVYGTEPQMYQALGSHDGQVGELTMVITSVTEGMSNGKRVAHLKGTIRGVLVKAGGGSGTVNLDFVF